METSSQRFARLHASSQALWRTAKLVWGLALLILVISIVELFLTWPQGIVRVTRYAAFGLAVIGFGLWGGSRARERDSLIAKVQDDEPPIDE